MSAFSGAPLRPTSVVISGFLIGCWWSRPYCDYAFILATALITGHGAMGRGQSRRMVGTAVTFSFHDGTISSSFHDALRFSSRACPRLVTFYANYEQMRRRFMMMMIFCRRRIRHRR